MADQLPLFQRKTFPVTHTQGIPITPPGAASAVLSTLPAYYTHLQATSPSVYTPGDFTGDIKKFGLFLREKTLQEITTTDVRSWLSVLKTQEHMSEKSISRKRSALSNYFTWLITERVIEHNPMAGIANSKVTSPLPPILFDTEVTQLLQAASSDSRTYLLVLLLVETGLKTEEVMTLRREHIDVSNAYTPEVWVKHSGKKAKKDRKLKLPREFVAAYEEYTKTYAISDLLFPLSQRRVRYLLSLAGEKARLTKQVSPQLLRDTCAVRLLKHGEAMETVLQKLGLTEATWEDAKLKYAKLIIRAL